MHQNENILVTKSSIIPLLKRNETQIIYQRHCNYDRVNGGLIDDSVQYQKELVKSFMQDLLVTSNIDELKNTYILFIASETKSNGDFKRCVESNKIVMQIVKAYFKELGISQNQIINLSEQSNYNQKIKETSQIAEPKLFTNDIDYFRFLFEKHNGINKDFWIDFEEDNEFIRRKELQAEGPDEIAERGLYFLKVLQKYSNAFHKTNTNSRLIIWCTTHYDLISPLVKKAILGYNKTDIVSVEYCGGLSFILNENNNINANLNGINYPIDLQDTQQPHRHF